MKHTRILFCLLAAVILASCGESAVAQTGDTPSDGTAPAQEEITEAVTEDIYADHLGSYDFGGETFSLYTRANIAFHYALDTAETDGSPLNDAIFERNRRLEEKYNFRFTEFTEENQPTTARAAILAGDDTYDIVTTRIVYAYNLATEGLLQPVTDLPLVDLSRPYWDQQLAEDLSIGDKSYFAVGAFNITGYDFTHMLAFNKGLISQFDMGDPYETVRSGKWTLDEMQTMMRAVTSDVNGDGKMDKNDRYGLLSSAKQILPNFWIAAGELSVDKDAKNYPVPAFSGDEGFTKIFERTMDLAWTDSAWHLTTSTQNVDPDEITMFTSDLGLFIDMTAFHLESLRTMDTDFGILPYPKADEAQKEYQCRIEGCELFGIPKTNMDLERTSVILEAMASDSAKNVLPVYYDLLLKSKYTRDSASEEMINIIFENRVLDWGDTIWCDIVRDGPFMSMMQQNNRDLASKAESLLKKLNKEIEKTVAAFEALD